MRGALLAGIVVVPAAFALAPAPGPVRETRANEQEPAAGDGYLAWSQSRKANRRLFDVWVGSRSPGHRPFKANPAGTQARTGGIDGRRLVYQQIRRGRSDVKFFDLVSRRRSNPPRGVNTSASERRPTLSGEWLLFGRVSGQTKRVFLRNLGTGREIGLDSVSGRDTDAVPGQVNGNFAVWTKCTAVATCDVFRYDIAQATTAGIPAPSGTRHYGASVSIGGVVYFGRSGPTCGSSAALVRHDPAAEKRPTAVLLTLPPGQSLRATHADALSPRIVEIYFDPFDCRKKAGDVWRFTDVRLPPTAR